MIDAYYRDWCAKVSSDRLIDEWEKLNAIRLSAVGLKPDEFDEYSDVCAELRRREMLDANGNLVM